MIDYSSLMLGAAGIAGLAAAAQVIPVATAFPQIRVPLTPRLSGIGQPGHVALTFDDGPHQIATPKLLKLLDDRGVKATFFLLGRMTAGLPSLAAEIAAAGHEIALHGMDHRSLLRMGPRATYRDIAHCRDVVGEVTGQTPSHYRPPYGVLTGSGLNAVRKLGLTPVLWSAEGRDWESGSTPQSITKMILRDLKSGGTILMHDSDVMSFAGSWKPMMEAFPQLLDRITEMGLAAGPLRDHGRPGDGSHLREAPSPVRN